MPFRDEDERYAHIRATAAAEYTPAETSYYTPPGEPGSYFPAASSGPGSEQRKAMAEPTFQTQNHNPPPVSRAAVALIEREREREQEREEPEYTFIGPFKMQKRSLSLSSRPKLERSATTERDSEAGSVRPDIGRRLSKKRFGGGGWPFGLGRKESVKRNQSSTAVDVRGRESLSRRDTADSVRMNGALDHRDDVRHEPEAEVSQKVEGEQRYFTLSQFMGDNPPNVLANGNAYGSHSQTHSPHASTQELALARVETAPMTVVSSGAPLAQPQQQQQQQHQHQQQHQTQPDPNDPAPYLQRLHATLQGLQGVIAETPNFSEKYLDGQRAIVHERELMEEVDALRRRNAELEDNLLALGQRLEKRLKDIDEERERTQLLFAEREQEILNLTAELEVYKRRRGVGGNGNDLVNSRKVKELESDVKRLREQRDSLKTKVKDIEGFEVMDRERDNAQFAALQQSVKSFVSKYFYSLPPVAPANSLFSNLPTPSAHPSTPRLRCALVEHLLSQLITMYIFTTFPSYGQHSSLSRISTALATKDAAREARWRLHTNNLLAKLDPNGAQRAVRYSREKFLLEVASWGMFQPEDLREDKEIAQDLTDVLLEADRLWHHSCRRASVKLVATMEISGERKWERDVADSHFIVPAEAMPAKGEELRAVFTLFPEISSCDGTYVRLGTALFEDSKSFLAAKHVATHGSPRRYDDEESEVAPHTPTPKHHPLTRPAPTQQVLPPPETPPRVRQLPPKPVKESQSPPDFPSPPAAVQPPQDIDSPLDSPGLSNVQRISGISDPNPPPPSVAAAPVHKPQIVDIPRASSYISGNQSQPQLDREPLIPNTPTQPRRSSPPKSQPQSQVAASAQSAAHTVPTVPTEPNTPLQVKPVPSIPKFQPPVLPSPTFPQQPLIFPNTPPRNNRPSNITPRSKPRKSMAARVDMTGNPVYSASDLGMRSVVSTIPPPPPPVGWVGPGGQLPTPTAPPGARREDGSSEISEAGGVSVANEPLPHDAPHDDQYDRRERERETAYIGGVSVAGTTPPRRASMSIPAGSQVGASPGQRSVGSRVEALRPPTRGRDGESGDESLKGEVGEGL